MSSDRRSLRRRVHGVRPEFGIRLALGLTAFSLVWAVPASAQTPPPPLSPRDAAMTIPGDFTFASVGDLIIRRPAS